MKVRRGPARRGGSPRGSGEQSDVLKAAVNAKKRISLYFCAPCPVSQQHLM